MDNFIENFVENFEVNSGIKNWHDESGPGTFGDNFRHISRTISRTIGGTISETISWTISGHLTSYNRIHSLYQHISGIKNGHNESGYGTFGDNFMTIFRTVLVTIPRTISRTTKLTSNNRTHSLYQHISGIKNGHNESGPGKPYDISCATLRTFNINICVSFLLFVYPTLNAGLVDPFCRAPAPKKQKKDIYKFKQARDWDSIEFRI